MPGRAARHDRATGPHAGHPGPHRAERRPGRRRLRAGAGSCDRLDELVDGDPVEALKRLFELDAVRILTIHKCKGLEFDKVVVLGVEEELFWGDAAMSEFFVAISRAKNELILTHADFRARPGTPSSTGGRTEPPRPSFWLTPTTPETNGRSRHPAREPSSGKSYASYTVRPHR